MNDHHRVTPRVRARHAAAGTMLLSTIVPTWTRPLRRLRVEPSACGLHRQSFRFDTEYTQSPTTRARKVNKDVTRKPSRGNLASENHLYSTGSGISKFVSFPCQIKRRVDGRHTHGGRGRAAHKWRKRTVGSEIESFRNRCLCATPVFSSSRNGKDVQRPRQARAATAEIREPRRDVIGHNRAGIWGAQSASH